jgi:hypothetical protein
MNSVHQFLTILMIGVVGGIIYTLATHTAAIDSTANGLDKLYKTATGATLGQVA